MCSSTASDNLWIIGLLYFIIIKMAKTKTKAQIAKAKAKAALKAETKAKIDVKIDKEKEKIKTSKDGEKTVKVKTTVEITGGAAIIGSRDILKTDEV